MADVIVLGAGIIGVSTAVHLAQRGRSVVLVDRRGPGQETSFGNAGLIQREGVVPYGFPQQLTLLLRYALNNRIDAHYHLKNLPSQVAFLARYWWNSNAKRHQMIAKLYAPLIEHSISEHNALIEAAGAQSLIRKNGWIQTFRTPSVMDGEVREAERLQRENGLNYQVLSSDELARAEPALTQRFAGAVRWSDPWSVLDPYALTQSYVALFEKLGGRVVTGDAMSLASGPKGGWQVMTEEGPVEGKEVVVALGPWSEMLTAKLGYAFPLGVKRGYHMHYSTEGGATLNNWLLDTERGYVLAPMSRGLRLTTGAEFAARDAPKTPVQLERAEKVVRAMLPLGKRLDAEPWMGARPCTPDMMPVIGAAPRHEGIWFAFGHAHHGLTLGPITGRVIAEAMAGEKPLIDISAYRPDRFIN